MSRINRYKEVFFIFIRFNNKRILYVKYLFIVILLAISIRLLLLQLYPTENVSTQYQNTQSEVISDNNYILLDTNGKNIKEYSKEFILVIDKKPFSLNSYEQSLESLLTLNYIMKEENSQFDFYNIMASEGKTYFKISEDSYNKINLLTDLKGVYTYVKDKTEKGDAWNIENYLSKISSGEKYSQDSLQNKLLQYINENNIPRKDFYLNEKSKYVSSGVNNTSNNKNIKLTIDKEIEDKIRNVLLKENYSNLNDLGVVLMEANTGKIRALVQKDESKANINICATGIGYEPGSVFKLITLASALEEGKVTMNDMYYCSGTICKNTIHGWITLSNALNKSCNDTFAEIGSKVGYEKLMEYCNELGMFNKVLDLEDESSGLKPKKEAGLNNISIGQCITLSPLQILGGVNTIVNDGIYVKPYIIESIVDENDEVIESFNTEEKNIFSKSTSLIIKNSMVNVVNYGTGVNAKIEGYEIGGKTGSATSGTGKSTHAWFIGFFEYNDIKYTMVVFVPNISESGENGEELGGGNTAAPIFRDIVENIAQENK